MQIRLKFSSWKASENRFVEKQTENVMENFGIEFNCRSSFSGNIEERNIFTKGKHQEVENR